MKKIAGRLKTGFWKCALSYELAKYAYVENFLAYDNAITFLVLLAASFVM